MNDFRGRPISDSEQSHIHYPLDSRPPLLESISLGLQHILTMFGATISVPLLLGPILFGQGDVTNTGILISSVMVCSGVATFLQVNFGSRLPIIQGVSFAFVPAFLAVANSDVIRGTEVGGSEKMAYIAGAIILGSIVEMFVGFSGLIGKLRDILSPVVIGPVIMLIGLSLYDIGAPKAAKSWWLAGLTIGMILFFSLVLSHRSTFFSIFPVLLSLILVYSLCAVLTYTGVISSSHPAYIDLSGVHSRPWLRSPGEVVLPWGWPKFHVGFFIAILAGYLASMIESVGDYYACAAMADEDRPSDWTISRGIGFEGVGCACSGFLGGFSSTSYSENIGLIGLTGVASRYVVTIGAFLLIGLGLFAKFGAFVATIPEPVVGGLYCTLLGLISAVGVQQLAKADLSSERNLLIAGFILFMGLSVPAWIEGAGPPGTPNGEKQITSFFQQVFESTYLQKTFSDVLTAICSSGMGVAAILGMIIDNVAPGTDEERGF